MSTLLETVNAVLTRTGQETVSSLANAEAPIKQAITAINDTLQDMCLRLRLPRQLLSGSVAIAEGASSILMPVPVDRLQPGSVWVDGSPGGNKESFAFTNVVRFNSFLPASGCPNVGLIQGQTIEFYPTADRAYTLRYRYYPAPAVLSAATDVLPIPADWEWILLKGAQSVMEQFLGEQSTSLAAYLDGIATLQGLASKHQGRKRMQGY
ncbi:MAG: hypothetical protein VKK59_06990 [Vampirovibrionales bacterium]|nr:hypothetical protein [Vampirovibrionales bacterium]